MTHWPHVRGLTALAGVWLSAIESEIIAVLWSKSLRKDYYLPLLYAVCWSDKEIVNNNNVIVFCRWYSNVLFINLKNISCFMNGAK